jgi:hypothetical protein
MEEVRTDLDITTCIKQDVVTLDITMDNALLMEMLQSTTSLRIVSKDELGIVVIGIVPQDR